MSSVATDWSYNTVCSVHTQENDKNRKKYVGVKCLLVLLKIIAYTPNQKLFACLPIIFKCKKLMTSAFQTILLQW